MLSAMKILTQLALLMAICLLADVVSKLLPFTFPPALIALFLLLLLLGLRIVRTESLEEVSSFLVTNMAFFFVPAGIQIMKEAEVLRSAFFEIIAITVISLFTTFLAAAKTVELVERLIAGKKGKEEDQA